MGLGYVCLKCGRLETIHRPRGSEYKGLPRLRSVKGSMSKSPETKKCHKYRPSKEEKVDRLALEAQAQIALRAG